MVVGFVQIAAAKSLRSLEVAYYLGNEIIQRSCVSMALKRRADGIFMYTTLCQAKSWAASANWKPPLV